MSSPNVTDDESNSNVASDMTSFTGTVTNSLRNTNSGWGSSEHAENTISNERVSSSYRTSNSTQPYHNNLSESDTDSHGMAPEQQIFHVLNERGQSRECSIISEGCNDELENDISLSCNFSVNTINANSPNEEQEYQSSDSSLYDSIYEDYLSDVSDNETQDLAADENLFYFRNLQNLLENEDYAEIIRANFVVNRKEVLLAILMFVKRFSLPMAATVYCCKMINSFLSIPVIPDTHYSIDNLCYPKEGKENHAVCPKCKSYVSPFSKEERRIVCSICNLNIDLKSPLFHDYFTILDVKMEIKNLIESNSEYYTLITSARHREPNHCFKDIYDGIQYNKFVRSLPDTEKENYITATFNSDGSPILRAQNILCGLFK